MCYIYVMVVGIHSLAGRWFAAGYGAFPVKIFSPVNLNKGTIMSKEKYEVPAVAEVESQLLAKGADMGGEGSGMDTPDHGDDW